MCKKAIEDDAFIEFDIPLNGTGVNVWVSFPDDIPMDFHVHQRCVFESIRKAEERAKTTMLEDRAR